MKIISAEAALKDWRERHGISQNKLAKLLGVSQSTVCEWESGKYQPPAYLALALREIARQLRK